MNTEKLSSEAETPALNKGDVSSLFSLIRQKQKELDEWINSKDEETQHDFIMTTGNAQLLYIGKLEAYNEIVNLISEYNR